MDEQRFARHREHSEVLQRSFESQIRSAVLLDRIRQSQQLVRVALDDDGDVLGDAQLPARRHYPLFRRLEHALEDALDAPHDAVAVYVLRVISIGEQRTEVSMGIM